jgi:NAD(P)-dependent dehydrogenase (short-subunit alcohol dehydrogenase family)
VSFDEHIAGIDTGNAIGRFVQPEEIGWVAAFLASPRSITISGDPIPVGGGFLGSIYY